MSANRRPTTQPPKKISSSIAGPATTAARPAQQIRCDMCKKWHKPPHPKGYVGAMSGRKTCGSCAEKMRLMQISAPFDDASSGNQSGTPADAELKKEFGGMEDNTILRKGVGLYVPGSTLVVDDNGAYYFAIEHDSPKVEIAIDIVNQHPTEAVQVRVDYQGVKIVAEEWLAASSVRSLTTIPSTGSKLTFTPVSGKSHLHHAPGAQQDNGAGSFSDAGGAGDQQSSSSLGFSSEEEKSLEQEAQIEQQQQEHEREQEQEQDAAQSGDYDPNASGEQEADVLPAVDVQAAQDESAATGESVTSITARMRTRRISYKMTTDAGGYKKHPELVLENLIKAKFVIPMDNSLSVEEKKTLIEQSFAGATSILMGGKFIEVIIWARIVKFAKEQPAKRRPHERIETPKPQLTYPFRKNPPFEGSPSERAAEEQQNGGGAEETPQGTQDQHIESYLWPFGKKKKTHAAAPAPLPPPSVAPPAVAPISANSANGYLRAGTYDTSRMSNNDFNVPNGSRRINANAGGRVHGHGQSMPRRGPSERVLVNQY